MISAAFSADFSDWTAAVQDANKQLEDLKGTSSAIGPDMDKQAQAAGTAIRAMAGEVVTLGKQWVAAYGESEDATSKLTGALQSQGSMTAQVVADYQAMAEQFQNTTRYADDAVTRSQAIFTSIGKVGPENMKAAMDAAVDLAAFMGTDVETAATMMAKAFASGGEKLGQLGKIMGDSVEKGADMNTIMDAINKKFGGQAAADMETTNGKLANINNRMGEVEESAGAMVAAGLSPMFDLFNALPGPLQTVVAGFGVLGKDIGGLAFSFAGVVSSVAPLITMLVGSGGITAAIGAVSSAFSAILPFLGPAGWIAGGLLAVYLAFKNWDKITDIVSGVYNAIKTYLVDKFNGLVSAIMTPINAVVGGFKMMYDKVVGHSYVPDMIDGIRTEFGMLQSVMVEPAMRATDATTQAFADMAAATDKIKTYTLPGGSERDSVIAGWSPTAPLPGQSIYDMGFKSLSMGLPAPPMRGSLQLKDGTVINLNGMFISTPEELARVIGEAMISSYTQTGNRIPA